MLALCFIRDFFFFVSKSKCSEFIHAKAWNKNCKRQKGKQEKKQEFNPSNALIFFPLSHLFMSFVIFTAQQVAIYLLLILTFCQVSSNDAIFHNNFYFSPRRGWRRKKKNSYAQVKIKRNKCRLWIFLVRGGNKISIIYPKHV